MRAPALLALLPATLCLLSPATPAWAQGGLQAVDPDLPAKPATKAPAPAPSAPAPKKDTKPVAPAAAPPPARAVTPTPAPPPARPAPSQAATPAPAPAPAAVAKPAAAAPTAPAPAAPAPAPALAAGKGVRPLLTPRATEASLMQAWEKWKAAVASGDFAQLEASQAELVRLKEELGIQDLEAYSAGFSRAARGRMAAGDPAGAVQLALGAVELAPSLPYAHLTLAHAYLFADVTSPGRAWGPLRQAFTQLFVEPPYLRPALADLGAAVMLALLATAAAITLALFARRARYAFHDFHHLFPKAAARWQTALVGAVLLTLPVVFRLGFTPILLTLLAAVALYLTPRERWVAVVAVALLGALPHAAGELVRRTEFAGTPAEAVHRLERGGPDAHAAAARIQARLAQEQATYAELFALGRFHYRRGRYEEAIKDLQAAASLREGDARLLTNLGNALMAKGDLEGAIHAYEDAAQRDRTLAAPLFNLSKALYRRAATLPYERTGAELERSVSTRETANALDARLVGREDPPDDALFANRLLLSPELPRGELSKLGAASELGPKVEAQLVQRLLGRLPEDVAPYFPSAVGLLLLAFGYLARPLRAARACSRCGQAACQKCDPELPPGSQDCTQCVNAFARKGLVPPAEKARKQLEIARYKGRQDRLAYVLGAVVSGLGHLFSGRPVQGAVHAFLFLLLLSLAFFRDGFLRAPYGELPQALRLAPVGLVFLLVYVSSLRSLYRRQTARG